MVNVAVAHDYYALGQRSWSRHFCFSGFGCTPSSGNVVSLCLPGNDSSALLRARTAGKMTEV